MTVQIIAEAEALLHKAAALFASIGHAGEAKVHALIAEITGDVPKLEQEVVADATQVVHDAEAAMGPVLAEAEADAHKVAGEAVADVENAVQPPAAS